MTRMNRILAFCDWLETIPPDPPFFQHADFSKFADLTDGEIMAAEIEMRRRSESAAGEAEELRAEARRRATCRAAIVANDDDDGGPDTA
jgi:hypothetical protein